MDSSDAKNKATIDRKEPVLLVCTLLLTQNYVGSDVDEDSGHNKLKVRRSGAHFIQLIA